MSGQRQTLPPLAALKPGRSGDGNPRNSNSKTERNATGIARQRRRQRLHTAREPDLQARLLELASGDRSCRRWRGGGDAAAPSRSAFSCAAFCARSRLSASICALIAARAFLSFSFSKKMGRVKVLSHQLAMGERGGVSERVSERGRTAALCLEVLQDLLVL